jgi:tetratricopeptide (TPR) repeat protein
MSSKVSRKRREQPGDTSPASAAPAPAARAGRREVGLLAGLLLLTIAVYSRSLANGFIAFDDPGVVSNNPYIRELSLANLGHWLTRPVQYMYMPLALLTYAIDYRLGGLDPWIYHLDNLLLHLACVVLVWWVVRQLTGRPRAALLVAAAFAVHPVNVDTVASVATRTNLLATLFSLLAFAGYGRYLERGERVRHLAWAFAAFVLAASAKSSAVVLPPTLFLWDYLRGRRWRWKLLVEKLPFFAAALAFGIVTLTMRTDDVLPPVHYGPLDRALVFVYALASYCVRLLAPLRLSMAYAFPVKHGPWLPLPYYLAPALLALAVWGLHRLRVPRRTLVFGLAFFVLHVGLSPLVLLIDGFMANRYAYLAYLGLFLVLADLVERAWDATAAGRSRALRLAARATPALLAAGFSALTYARVPVWLDTKTLLGDVSRKQPGIPWVYGTRGLVELHAGELAAARRDLDEALRLDPQYTPSLCYRGVLNYLEQDYPAAISDLSRALAIDAGISGAYRDRGKAKLALQDEDGALDDFTRAIALDGNSEALFWRALLLHGRGDDRAALPDLDAAVAGTPTDAEAVFLRAMVQEALGDHDKACADVARARELGYEPPKDQADRLPQCP